MGYSDRELLARIVKCEAGGEGENGMKGVATVVMNRVNVSYGEYRRIGQGSLRNIVYQKGQFDCTRETIGGKPNSQVIYNTPPESVHYSIADWALSGNKLNTVGNALWYFNPYRPSCITYFPKNKVGIFQVRINQHCFYNPTALYAKT